MRRAVLGMLALAALAAGVAGAQDRPRPTFAKDARGDAGRGPLDVVRVALGRTTDGRLRGEITMASGWDAADVGPGGSVCLRLHVRRAPDAAVPEYMVCATPPAEGDRLKARVLRERANGLPKPVATAVVTRPTTRTVFLRFAPSAIGAPARVRFSAEAVTRGEGCSEPFGCRDLAPDAPGARDYRLRSTTDRR